MANITDLAAAGVGVMHVSAKHVSHVPLTMFRLLMDAGTRPIDRGIRAGDGVTIQENQFTSRRTSWHFSGPGAHFQTKETYDAYWYSIPCIGTCAFEMLENYPRRK